MSTQHEDIFVKQFKSYINALPRYFHFVHMERGKLARHMDIEFVFIHNGVSRYVRLEVKENKSTNFSNNVLLPFGAIMKGRRLPYADKDRAAECSDVVYGILIPPAERTCCYIDRWKKVISERDWRAFGDTFNVKYLFYYDNEETQLLIADWVTFPDFNWFEITQEEARR